MSTPENLVWQDEKITQILSRSYDAAQQLFEAYRIESEHSKDEFVAALIARLCMLHARTILHNTRNRFNPQEGITE